MDRQLSELLEELSDSCTQCGECTEECLFLKEFALKPKDFVKELLEEKRSKDSSLLYSCNLCGMCSDICPESIDLSKLFILLRKEWVRDGKELLPALTWVQEGQSFFKKGIMYCPPGKAEKRLSESVFFPGCNLCGYNPDLVLKTYAYLTDKIPSTGILLDCCGAPYEGLGASVDFEEKLASVRSHMEKMGVSRIITACPTCYRTFRNHLPQFEVSTVYEIMEREGLPETGNTAAHQFFLFHSCVTRRDVSVKQAVHNLVNRMGYELHRNEALEKKAGCCGMGGMVGLTNPVLAMIAGHERTEEVPCDIVTYCATCRDALIHYRPAVHILDLLFNPRWREARERPPLEENAKQENLSWLKAQLERRLGPCKDH